MLHFLHHRCNHYSLPKRKGHVLTTLAIHHSTVPPVIHHYERSSKSSSVSLVCDEHHCDDTNDGEVSTVGRAVVSTMPTMAPPTAIANAIEGPFWPHSSSSRRPPLRSASRCNPIQHPRTTEGSLAGTRPPPVATTTPMDGLSRRIRTSVMRGAASDRRGRRCVGALLGQFRIGLRDEYDQEGRHRCQRRERRDEGGGEKRRVDDDDKRRGEGWCDNFRRYFRPQRIAVVR